MLHQIESLNIATRILTWIREQMDFKWRFSSYIKLVDLFLNVFFNQYPNFLMVLCLANYSDIVTLWVTVEISGKLAVCVCPSSILISYVLFQWLLSFPTIMGLELHDNYSSGMDLAEPQIHRSSCEGVLKEIIWKPAAALSVRPARGTHYSHQLAGSACTRGVVNEPVTYTYYKLSQKRYCIKR
jgi:hypothetical protein